MTFRAAVARRAWGSWRMPRPGRGYGAPACEHTNENRWTSSRSISGCRTGRTESLKARCSTFARKGPVTRFSTYLFRFCRQASLQCSPAVSHPDHIEQNRRRSNPPHAGGRRTAGFASPYRASWSWPRAKTPSTRTIHRPDCVCGDPTNVRRFYRRASGDGSRVWRNRSR